MKLLTLFILLSIAAISVQADGRTQAYSRILGTEIAEEFNGYIETHYEGRNDGYVYAISIPRFHDFHSMSSRVNRIMRGYGDITLIATWYQSDNKETYNALYEHDNGIIIGIIYFHKTNKILVTAWRPE